MLRTRASHSRSNHRLEPDNLLVKNWRLGTRNCLRKNDIRKQGSGFQDSSKGSGGANLEAKEHYANRSWQQLGLNGYDTKVDVGRYDGNSNKGE